MLPEMISAFEAFRLTVASRLCAKMFDFLAMRDVFSSIGVEFGVSEI